MIIIVAIIGAIIGYNVFGGFALSLCSLDEYMSEWKILVITLGTALVGAAIGGGVGVVVGKNIDIDIVVEMSPASKECLEGTVQSEDNNKLYSGRVRMEVEKK